MVQGVAVLLEGSSKWWYGVLSMIEFQPMAMLSKYEHK